MKKKNSYAELMETGNFTSRKEVRKAQRKQKKSFNAKNFVPLNKDLLAKTDKPAHPKQQPIQKSSQAKPNKQGSKSKNIKSKPNEQNGGIIFSTNTSDRMRKLEEFVNKNGNPVGKPKPKKEVKKLVQKTPATTPLIKDKKKLDELREMKEVDDCEIKKLDKLLRRNSKHKIKIPGFDDDFGSLLTDIDDGSMANSELYNEMDIAEDSDDNEVIDIVKNLVDEEIARRIESSNENEQTEQIVSDNTAKSTKRKLLSPVDTQPAKKIMKLSPKKPKSNLKSKSAKIVKFNDYLDIKYIVASNSIEEDGPGGFETRVCPEYELKKTDGGKNLMTMSCYTSDDESLYNGLMEKFMIENGINSEEFETLMGDFITNEEEDSENDSFSEDSLYEEDMESDEDIENYSLVDNSFDEEDMESDEDIENDYLEEDPIDAAGIESDHDLVNEPLEEESIDDEAEKVTDADPQDEAETEDEPDIVEEKEELEEDIYGRLRDKAGNVVQSKGSQVTAGKYIPPAQRKLMSLGVSDQKKAELAAMTRKIKGLMNRLTDSNVGGILGEMETMYRNFSRNDLNEALCQIFFDSMVLPSLSTEKLVQEHAYLISVLSTNSGAEIGSHILTEFVNGFMTRMDQYEETAAHLEDNKEMENILSFVSQLYNFRVVVSGLIFDIMMKLSEKMRAKEIDLILLILRSVGFTLRKMDPTGLKKMIIHIQQQASCVSQDEGERYSRLTFMFEILKAIKNNNISKLPNYDPTHVEKLRSLDKTLVRRGCFHPDLNVSLDDIVKSKSAGRWWLVGSAWSGSLKDTATPQNTTAATLNALNTPLELFKKQAAKFKLSRPPLINIFYILTEGSIDARDSFNKLVDLNLNKHKQPLIFNVLLFCLQKAKFYDPFYAQVVILLCSHNQKYKWMLKKAIWDKFKDLDNMKGKYLDHLAKFVAYLITEKFMDMSLFKQLDLTSPTDKLVKFFRHCLVTIIFSGSGSNNVVDIVVPLWDDKTSVLRKSILIFMKVCVVPKISKEHRKQVALFMHLLTKDPTAIHNKSS